MTTTDFDFRNSYAICEHLAALSREESDAAQIAGNVEHSGFRLCCPGCFDAGLLFDKTVHTEERGGFAVLVKP